MNLYIYRPKPKNMKQLAILCAMLLAGPFVLRAQLPIEPFKRYEGTVEYQKTTQPATIMEFKYPERDLEKALQTYIEKLGGTVKTQKGFYYAKGIPIQEKGNRYHDVYYKVNGSGKGDNMVSKVSIILAEPGENILLRNGASQGSAAGTAAGVAVFGTVGEHVGSYDYERKVKAQEEELARAQRKADDLVKKKDKLTRDLELTDQELKRQEAEVEKARAILEQIKAKKQ
jgi:hypothetical protein